MHSLHVAPSVLAANPAHLENEIRALDGMGADIFHWDIMDGHFVPNLTFGPHVVKALRSVTEKEFDVHLMVTTPEKWFMPFVDVGADAISFHAEAVDDIAATIALLKNKNIKAGVALNPQTEISVIAPELFAQIDRLLIMTVNPGFGGQAFIDQTAKIKQAAALREKFPQLDIMIDGGVNAQTAPMVVQAGATSLVSGSALMNSPDRAAFISTLKALS